MSRIRELAEATDAELDDYLEHLDLERNPFAHPATLDEYVLPGDEEIADIAAALRSYTGPILIHSEYSGVGKTTLLAMLLEEFGEEYRPVSIPEHNVTPYELVAIVADEIGVGKSSSTKLTETKIRNAELDETVLLGVDEFGLNDPDTLHVIQYLNDLDSFKVILTGMTSQWEAIATIGSEGRAFQRRVSYQLRLQPFDREQTTELVRRRLTVGRGKDVTDVELNEVPIEPFTEDALDVIHERAKGVPAVVTAACAELVGLAAYRFSTGADATIDEELAETVEYAEPEVE